MRDNKAFPKAIAKYLSITETKNLEGDGILLLIEIFDSNKFKDVADKQFVNALFNSLEYLKDEKVVLAVVYILISISNQYTDPEENIVLQFCITHQYKRYFAECTLLLLNKGSASYLDKILLFVSAALHYEKTRNEFIYDNDLKELTSIAIREFTNSDTVDLKVRYLDVLDGLIQTNFFKESMHRSDDICTIFEEISITEGVDDKILKKVEEIKSHGILKL